MNEMRRLRELIEGITRVYSGAGPLWHGTDVLSLAAIIVSGRLEPSIDHARGPHRGVSLTYDLDTAWHFAHRSTDIERSHMLDWFRTHQKGPDPKGIPMRGGVLEFDATKMQDHKLYHYFDPAISDSEDDESEVRVMGTGMPLQPFLTAIHLDAADIRWFIDYMKGAPRDAYSDPDGIVRDLLALQNHPLCRSP